MNVLLCQLDGSLPNLALMRIAAHHRERGDRITLCHGAQFQQREFWDSPYELVYASVIFLKTRPLIQRLLCVFPAAVIGGTGYDLTRTVEDVGVSTSELDYSIYPRERRSIGFTQRGCRLRCPFCVVPRKEGKVTSILTIPQLWRGEPWPKELLLPDNDFFGQAHWRERIREIREGGFKVSFNQGINARCLTEEAAEAIASVDYSDDSMNRKRIYTAWDNRDDEERLFAGLRRLVKYGVTPDQIMVYMLIGYWPGETQQDREYRRVKLREFGVRPYPMPYIRTPELVGMQRWCVGAYDKRVSWKRWVKADYQPANLGYRSKQQMELELT